MTQRSFKTRLKLNNHEAGILAQWCGISRLAYNACLAQWNDDHKTGTVKHNYYSIKKWFNAVKRDRYPFITECSKWVPEAAIKDLDTAYRNFFARRSRHPRFHRKGRNDSSRIDGSVVRIDGDILRLPKKLTLRMAERFRYENTVRKINNVTVSRKAGWWFVSISCDIDDKARENQASGIVGIDMGVKSLATCSDGTVIDNPKAYRMRLRRLRRLQRSLARKQKGSSNRRKAKLKLQRYQYHTARMREDWTHKATKRIADNNRICFMEDLNVQGMTRNHNLAMAVADAAMAGFARQLGYKTTVRKISRWYPSSQTCSACGACKPMPLAERTYACDVCGLNIDRDMNAALNILHVGMANYPELMPVEDETTRTCPARPGHAKAPYEAGIDHQTTMSYGDKV